MKYSLIIFSVLIILLYLMLEALNFFVAGFPSYKHPRINISINNLISDKSLKIKNYDYKDFLRVYSEEYKKLNYTGRIKRIGCGSQENGKYNLIFKTDKYGFRENKDERYSYSDVVLIGDSFTMSNCINKPYDFKSQLEKVNSNNSYLNLGIHGTQPWQQLAIAKKILNNTDFKKLVWIFYEMNDYENPRNNNLDTYNKMISDKETLNNSINTTINLWSDFLSEPVIEKDYLVEEKYIQKNSFLTKLKIFFIYKTRGLSTITKYFKTYPELLDKESYNSTVNDMYKFAKNKKVKELYIYYVPSYIRLSYKKFNNHPQIIQLNNLKNNVKKIAENNNFNFIDGEDAFKDLKNKLSIFHYELPTHYNEFGYKLMAEDVFKKINIKK
ncbi:hypothetical protein [Candidatus Pelagibacter sp.]|uniref:hypothetical protein n=1 Tax=Candidatus Pelagibacter sp. TaxID=2024849 RepID=UPI003D0BC9BE